MSAAVEHFRREWDAAHATLPGAGIGWVDRFRREALDRFCERGFPTPRDEDWKYTNVRPLERRAFRLDPGIGAAAPGAEGAATDVEGAPSAGRLADLDSAAALVFVNGRLSTAHSGGNGALPAGVRVDSLARVLESDPERLEPFLSRAGDPDSFASLNRAFLGGGAFVSIARACAWKRPSSSCS